MKNKTSAVISLVIHSAVVVGLVVVLIVGINSGWPGVVHLFNDDDDAASAVEVSEKTEVDVAGITDIEINWIAGSINIGKCGGDKIVFSESAPENAVKMSYAVSGDTLKIYFDKTVIGVGLSGVNSNKYKSKELTVSLPDKLYDEIQVNGVSADVSVKGITVNSLETETISGDVEFDGVINTKIDGESVSGDLTVKTSVCPKKVEFDSVSGNVQLVIPEPGDFDADVSTVSGKFSTDFQCSSKGGEHICGNGANDFEFNTVSGNVSIYKKQ